MHSLPQPISWPSPPRPHPCVAFELNVGESLYYHFPPGRKGMVIILLNILNTLVRTIMSEKSALAVVMDCVLQGHLFPKNITSSALDFL